MNEIKLFENVLGNVRATIIDGDVYFVAKDVAECLGYKDTTNAIKLHCRGVVKHHLTDNLGRAQQVNYINERDVLRLIVKSKLPEAEKFESWVFDEVIPTVLKTGSYGVPQLSDRDKAILLVMNAKTEFEHVEALKYFESAITAPLVETIEIQKPKVETYDKFINTEYTFNSTQLAKVYGLTSAVKLNKMLNEKHICFKQGKTWHCYSHVNKNWHKEVISEFGTQLRFTADGVIELSKLLDVKINTSELSHMIDGEE